MMQGCRLARLFGKSIMDFYARNQYFLMNTQPKVKAFFFHGEKKNSANTLLSISAVSQDLYLFQYKTIFGFSFARFCVFSV